MVAEEQKFYMGYLFTDSKFEDFDKILYGTSLVKLDSVTSCTTIYYKTRKMLKPIYERQFLGVEYVTMLDTTAAECLYYGKSTDGTYFVEKQFYNRPTREGIIFYQIPEEYYKDVIIQLDKQWYIPLELFRDSLLMLMDYKLIGTCVENYEEGLNGGAFAKLDDESHCFIHYFQGAMIATPLYMYQIKDIEYVFHSDSSHHENRYSSQTGRMHYGKSGNGTYFVEKQFYDKTRPPQGIILFNIPEIYYEDILLKLCSLPSLPLELFGNPM